MLRLREMLSSLIAKNEPLTEQVLLCQEKLNMVLDLLTKRMLDRDEYCKVAAEEIGIKIGELLEYPDSPKREAKLLELEAQLSRLVKAFQEKSEHVDRETADALARRETEMIAALQDLLPVRMIAIQYLCSELYYLQQRPLFQEVVITPAELESILLRYPVAGDVRKALAELFILLMVTGELTVKLLPATPESFGVTFESNYLIAQIRCIVANDDCTPLRKSSAYPLVELVLKDQDTQQRSTREKAQSAMNLFNQLPPLQAIVALAAFFEAIFAKHPKGVL